MTGSQRKIVSAQTSHTAPRQLPGAEAGPRVAETVPAPADIFKMLLELSKRIPIRDIRGLALLIALSDESCRSIPAQPGVSVQHLASRLEEPEEVVRHLIRVAQIGGLVTRCGHVQRTFLYRITPEAQQKLERCLAIFRKIDVPAPAEHEGNL